MDRDYCLYYDQRESRHSGFCYYNLRKFIFVRCVVYSVKLMISQKLSSFSAIL